jgi:hypothetical protein
VAFILANVGTMPNVGHGKATTSPGSQNARTVESMTSSEPQPVVTFAAPISKRSAAARTTASA